MARWYNSQYNEAYPHPTALLYSRLGTCLYQMGLYEQWEVCQQKQGLETARQIETNLRWDGESEGGQGYDVVTKYLAQKSNHTSYRASISSNKPQKKVTIGTHKGKLVHEHGHHN